MRPASSGALRSAEPATAMRTANLRQLVLLVCLASPAPLFAQTGECDPEQKSGRLCIRIFGDKPGEADFAAEKARREAQNIERKLRAARRWEFDDQHELRLLAGQCWARSPVVYVADEGKAFYFASVNVGGSWSRPQVIIQSEPGLERIPFLFDTQIDGLGLWTEFIPLQTVDGVVEDSRLLLGFLPEKSLEIVESLRIALSFQLRLRYAPKNRTYNSPTITLDGFHEAFEQVNQCY